MEELNNSENINFSENPEYINVFDDEISTEATSLPGTCNNSSVGTTAVTTGTPITGVCNPITGVCTPVDPTPTPDASKLYYCNAAIKIKSILGNGTTGYTGNLTEGEWGNILKLECIKGYSDVIKSGKTYEFIYKKIQKSIGFNNYEQVFYYTFSETSENELLTGAISSISCTFKIVGMDGHEYDNTEYQISNFITRVMYDYDYSESTYLFDCLTYATISLSAKTYAIAYDDSKSSTDFETTAKKNIKIGTKFSIYSNYNKTKKAYTKNGLSESYSVSCYYSDNNRYIPFSPFFINTSAETIYITYERCGEEYGGTTISLNDGQPYLRPIQSTNKLATLKSLYSSSSGLGITSFQKMFSGETITKENMILTPYNYDKLSISVETSGTTKYSYKKPIMYYSATTSDKNYCLKINDISTFDENIFLVFTGYTQSIYSVQDVHPNFQKYKNYPLKNIKDKIDWNENGNEEMYFTFYL